MRNKKVVLDTNGLISSLSRRGRFYPIWKSFQEGVYTLCISNEILDEYVEIIGRKMTPDIAENVANLLLKSFKSFWTNYRRRRKPKIDLCTPIRGCRAGGCGRSIATRCRACRWAGRPEPSL